VAIHIFIFIDTSLIRRRIGFSLVEAAITTAIIAIATFGSLVYCLPISRRKTSQDRSCQIFHYANPAKWWSKTGKASAVWADYPTSLGAGFGFSIFLLSGEEVFSKVFRSKI
jgi:hypothetical protein